LLPEERDLRTNENATALMISAESNADKTFKKLLFQAKMTRKDGMTALILAARCGFEEGVKLLHDQESGMFMDHHMNALTAAAAMGHLNCVKLLLNEAKEINGINSTALIEAARGGHVDVVKELIPYEANILPPKGISAIVTAAESGQLEAVKQLIDVERDCYRDGWTPLMAAITKNHQQVVEFLKPYYVGIAEKTCG